VAEQERYIARHDSYKSNKRVEAYLSQKEKAIAYLFRSAKNAYAIMRYANFAAIKSLA
jgi:hypothetical protein